TAQSTNHESRLFPGEQRERLRNLRRAVVPFRRRAADLAALEIRRERLHRAVRRRSIAARARRLDAHRVTHLHLDARDLGIEHLLFPPRIASEARAPAVPAAEHTRRNADRMAVRAHR